MEKEKFFSNQLRDCEYQIFLEKEKGKQTLEKF